MTPTPLPPSSTPIKPHESESSSHSLHRNFVRSAKSTDSLDMDGSTNCSIDESSQRVTPRLFQSFQWSNVFNGRNSKSTSQLNLINCDKMTIASVPNANCDALHNNQLSKGSIYSATNYLIYSASYELKIYPIIRLLHLICAPRNRFD